MKIIRVFPRRTAATPDDAMAFVGPPPFAAMRPKADAVHVSVTFTWDIPLARRLASSWGRFYDRVKTGGPALGDAGGEFTPGLYMKPGYLMTSRGCPQKCKSCLVPKREGRIRVLLIKDGHDVCDNNLLACPRGHIEAVLEMMNGQRARARFTGGLEARHVSPWFARALADMRLDIAYTAYDRPSSKPHVEAALRLLREAGGWCDGTARRRLACYVLVAHDGDTISEAVKRLEWVVSLGVQPFPMFYQPDQATRREEPADWTRALRPFIRPYLTPRPLFTEKPEAPKDKTLFGEEGE